MAPPSSAAPVIGRVEAALGAALGTTPGGPVQTPLSWAVLAVARRPAQVSASKVAGNAVAVAAGGDPNGALFFNQTPSLTYTVNPGQGSKGVVTGVLVGTDSDSPTLTYSVVNAPSHGSVAVGSDGKFTYTPDGSAAATGTTDTFTASVSDAGSGFHVHGIAGLLNMLSFGLLGDSGHTATTKVTVAVQPFRADGTALTATASVGNPDPTTGVVTGTVTTNDPAARLVYSGSTTTSKGSVAVNASTGAFTYTPTSSARHAAAKIGATAAVTTDSFTITATDGLGGTASVPVTVTISPTNNAPVAGISTVGTPNASTGVVTGTVAATDADRDTLSYSAPATTSKGTVTVNASTGAFTYTPTSRTTAGTDTFTVTVVDGYGGSTPIAVSVPVTAAPGTTSAKITYVFNYTSGANFWTPEAKAALQSSADAIAAYVVAPQPVTLTFDVTAENSPSSNTMASTGSDLISSRAGFYSTVVQNKILTGVDSNGSQADGTIDVNFGTGYAFGNTVGNSQYDFKSTMMHEMLHAYGFLSYIDEAGSAFNTGPAWTKFDSFIGTSTGTKVISRSTYAYLTAYNTNLTGGNGGLYFLGPAAIAAYGGPVPLYTPNPWEAGSSVSHLDDYTFTGANAQLMNAMADTGPGIRTLSPIELGILTDIGYTVNQNPSAAAVLFIGVIFVRRRRNR